MRVRGCGIVRLCFLLLVLSSGNLFVFAQSEPTGYSVRRILLSNPIDTIRLQALNDFAFNEAEDSMDQAFQASFIGLQQSRQIHNRYFEALFLQKLGICHDVANSLDSCLYYLTASRDLFQQINRADKSANPIADMAIAYHYRGVYEQAIRFQLQALEIRTRYQDLKSMSASLNNLGLTYRARRDYTKALHYYGRSLGIKQQLRDSMGMLNSYINLSALYNDAHRYDSSVFYSKAALQMATWLKKPKDILAAQSNLAQAYVNSEKYQEALPILNWLNVQARQKGAEPILLITLASMAEWNIHAQNYPEAEQNLLEGIRLARNIQKIEPLSKLYQRLASLHRLTNHYQSAVVYMDSAQQIRDSLLNVENSRQINELDIVYQSAERERRISELRLSGLKSAQEKQAYRLILMVALAILVLLVYLIRKISLQKQLIQKTLAEKEVLNREIHHRVKNNLQVISGLLSLQGAYLSDAEAQQAVRDGANRVESMSLIHQQLYQHENLTLVNMDVYLPQLASSIAQSMKPAGVDLQVRIDVGELDVEQAIPTGLVVNELLTNCFKYAFRKMPSGTVILKCFRNGTEIQLEISDTGIGADLEKLKAGGATFGYKMIHSFVRKLGGTINFLINGGLTVVIKFPSNQNADV